MKEKQWSALVKLRNEVTELRKRIRNKIISEMDTKVGGT